MEAVPLLAPLLSVPLGDRYAPLHLTPQRQRQQTLETLVAWLLDVANRQPVLFIVEDLHWLDPSTQDLLGLVISQQPTTRFLTVLVFRPDFRPPWLAAHHVTDITLSRLPQEQTVALAIRVAGDRGLASEILQQVVARTDGVPLFSHSL